MRHRAMAPRLQDFAWSLILFSYKPKVAEPLRGWLHSPLRVTMASASFVSALETEPLI